jgi:hypothetical protein
MSVRAVLCSAVILLSLPAWAETPNEWIELGARVHGAFGAFIPVGIRIGLDAKERIKAEARGLAVTYYTGEKAPRPCIADGVMLAKRQSGAGNAGHRAGEGARWNACGCRRAQPKNRRRLALHRRRRVAAEGLGMEQDL